MLQIKDFSMELEFSFWNLTQSCKLSLRFYYKKNQKVLKLLAQGVFNNKMEKADELALNSIFIKIKHPIILNILEKKYNQNLLIVNFVWKRLSQD